MKLYLVQHGKAEPMEVDPDRPLSEEGRREVEKIADFLQPMNLSVHSILHSGKSRAVQTAEILATAISSHDGLTQYDGLAPNDSVTPWPDELEEINRDILIVGHLPFLDKLASLLLAGRECAHVLDFQNAGVVCIERTEHYHYRVDWMILPRLLA